MSLAVPIFWKLDVPGEIDAFENVRFIEEGTLMNL